MAFVDRPTREELISFVVGLVLFLAVPLLVYLLYGAPTDGAP